MKKLFSIIGGLLIVGFCVMAQTDIPLWVSGNGSIVATSNQNRILPVFGQSAIGKTSGNMHIAHYGLLAPFNVSTSVNELKENNPFQFQNYPNPFKHATTISFNIPYEGFVTLRIIDVTGQQKCVIVSRNFEAGQHIIHYFNDELKAGAYFFTLEFEQFRFSRTMLKMD